MSASGTFRLALLSAFALIFSAACAAGNARRNGVASTDCIRSRNLRDFDALDARNLVIDGPGRTSYHLVLTSPSIGLEGEYAIGVYDDGDGRICPFGRDAIIIDGALTEAIRIQSIETIDEDQLEALKLEFGILVPAGNRVQVEQIL